MPRAATASLVAFLVASLLPAGSSAPLPRDGLIPEVKQVDAWFPALRTIARVVSANSDGVVGGDTMLQVFRSQSDVLEAYRKKHGDVMDKTLVQETACILSVGVAAMGGEAGGKVPPSVSTVLNRLPVRFRLEAMKLKIKNGCRGNFPDEDEVQIREAAKEARRLRSERRARMKFPPPPPAPRPPAPGFPEAIAAELRSVQDEISETLGLLGPDGEVPQWVMNREKKPAVKREPAPAPEPEPERAPVRPQAASSFFSGPLWERQPASRPLTMNP
eukprot:CAMPEP_0182888406 /NCGR_PEP_ID=MMETSP0034_2-20130328/21407_1 /TAXON_ID=156128 /ORGANISM="Nephroselmis pyriformis, Strain CCMP717" /LENGTH=273 /DNA_ID=CAMNT_0025021831 /DNA_START=211 /DNA_END=1029 /DNA_ORIENTATION=+